MKASKIKTRRGLEKGTRAKSETAGTRRKRREFRIIPTTGILFLTVGATAFSLHFQTWWAFILSILAVLYAAWLVSDYD